MRVVFVGFAQEQLGLSMLSAVLRQAGHETRLAFEPALFRDRYLFDVPLLAGLFDASQAVVDAVVDARPDLVAMSPITTTYGWSVDIARRVKAALDVPVILGGAHASTVPEVCLEEPCVDYVCVGEGELSVVALCDALEAAPGPPARAIPNLWWRGEEGELVRGPPRPLLGDLDALPLWDKELWQDVLPLRDSYLTMTSRGCPFRCSFCANHTLAQLAEGPPVRRRSVEHVLAELRQMKARYAFRFVEFADDVFTLDKRWLAAFLPRYRAEIGVPFSCMAHGRSMDAEIARWLREAGCARVEIGLQSTDPDTRARLRRRESLGEIERAVAVMTSAGLAVKVDHIFGLPGEPLEAQAQALAFYARFPLAHINTYWLTYLPGTDVIAAALAESRLTPEDVRRIERGQSRTYHHRLSDPTPPDERAPTYRRYELLFRLLPLVPGPLRARLSVDWVPPLPERVANALGLAADVASGLLRGDPEPAIYAKLYAHHLRRRVLGGGADA